MQSSLPTTMFVQNLWFLFIQILISHIFFPSAPIYMIFVGNRDELWKFTTIIKEIVKSVKTP
jgi:hypothetical protein